MNNKTFSGSVMYILNGSAPKLQVLGLYSTFNDAYDAMQEYFDKTLDEDGAGKYLYQFDTYTIFSQEVDLAVGNRGTYQRISESYVANYTEGVLKQLVQY